MRRSLLWIWALVAGMILIAGFAALSHATDGVIGDLYYATVSLLAAFGIAGGIVVHRPEQPLPWILLAVGQLAYTAGDVTYFVTEANGTTTYPDLADVFYLLQFPLVIAGLVLIIRRRTPGWHSPTWIDAAVLGTAATLIWWIYVIDPVTRGDDMGSAAAAVSVAYPVLDLVMLATALRLMLGGGGRPASFRFLLASLAAMLIGDTVYTAEVAWVSSDAMDMIWLSSYVLAAVAAMHPSMRSLDAKVTAQRAMATARRIGVLAVASLLAPAVLLIEHVNGDASHEPAIALTCMASFLLVLARMAGLVSEQRIAAITDGLTRLHTRGFFTDALTVACARASRGGHPVGIVIADVDHFKTINDTYGHPVGDEVLVEIGRRLRAASRQSDVVARYGGEEFAILLPGIGPEGVEAQGERIRVAIAESPFQVNGGPSLPVTISIGAASMPGAVNDPGNLIHAADQALYAAKRIGRNCVVSAARQPVFAPG
jgi:diguanylate cyclase (GGDEF)-like protein